MISINTCKNRTIASVFVTTLGFLSTMASYAEPATIKDKYIVVFKEDSFSEENHQLTARAEDIDQAVTRVMDEVKKQQIFYDKQQPKSLHTTQNKHKFIYRNVIKGFSAELTPEAVEKLKSDPMVAYVESDTLVTLDGFQSPAPSWGLDRIDQPNLPLDGVYQYAYDGSQAHVYVIDSGIRATHTEFAGRIGNGYDFIENDTTPNDCLGHGTHVAGTIGGKTYGVAKNVIIHPVKVFGCEGSSPASTIIAGIDWVRTNYLSPAVANMSLSGPVNEAENTAVQYLANYVTVAVAAGNQNTDACQQSPASASAAITVAASTTGDARASFSNKGNCVDIFAPGVGIVSSTITTDSSSAAWDGTSMATPHVAGVMALFRGRYPSASTSETVSAVLNSATTGKISDAQSTNNRLLSTNVTASACFLSGKSKQYVTRSNSAGYVAASQYASSYCGSCGYRMNTYDNISFEFFCN